MVFDPISDEQKKRFFRQNYGAHVPGYTGHCPTLKFRVGKRFGASTEEIMKELLEKKILKEGPYKPNSRRDARENATTPYEKDTKPEWKNGTHLFQTPPYILGYTGYIPGFNTRYGLSFMRAVEEGAKEWRENQNKLRARRDAAMRVRGGRRDPNNLLSQTRNDSVTVEMNHRRDKNPTMFHYEISPERPPIVGYTGHIPGARGEVALSKRYAQAARKGLELVRKEREERLVKAKNTNILHRVSDASCINGTDIAPL